MEHCPRWLAGSAAPRSWRQPSLTCLPGEGSPTQAPDSREGTGRLGGRRRLAPTESGAGMALRLCAVPGSQRPRHTVGPVHKKRPDMWPWSRPCTPRLGPRGRPMPQPWAGVSQRGHLHDDCRVAGRVEPGRSSSSLWASPCASGPRPRHRQEPRGHFARSLPSRVWARFRSQWAARRTWPSAPAPFPALRF